ncbi:glycosyltransferase family 61 protein [Candidatus Saccharibacteria bacterium]|nr:glycosyltransferase family 61 protein [Candidatus Saccharibacteria bacterium]
MNKKHQSELKSSARDFLRSDKLQVITIKNGLILPAHENSSKLWADGGVIDEKGNFVELSGNGYIFGGKYDYDEAEVKYVDEEVVFFGPFIKHWGHFICDQIGRLWYIKNNPQKYKIAYCGWNWRQGPGDLDGNYLELLELLGCKKSQFKNIQKPTRFKKIIIPELSFSGGNYYTKEFEELIDAIIKNVSLNKQKCPSKIYFSRTKFSNDKERGEEKIEKIFAKNGYQIMRPENLTVKEQIAYFNQADKVAMVAGSISHNLMFARNKNLEATILNKFRLTNNYQLVIDDMTKAKLTYIDCFKSIRQVLFGMGPFLLAPTKYLKIFLRDYSYQSTNEPSITLSDLYWYFKRYHEIYKDPNYKALLKSQKASVKSSKLN